MRDNTLGSDCLNVSFYDDFQEHLKGEALMKLKTIITGIQILLAILFTFIIVKMNLDVFTLILLIIIYSVIMSILNRVSQKLTETK